MLLESTYFFPAPLDSVDLTVVGLVVGGLTVGSLVFDPSEVFVAEAVVFFGELEVVARDC
jgi:hypothetical protein